MNLNPDIIEGLNASLRNGLNLFVTGYRPVLGCFETGSHLGGSIKCVKSSLVVRLLASLKKYFAVKSPLVVNAEQTVVCCRFSLSDAGTDIARQLQDKGDAVCASLSSPDSTAAGNAEMSPTLTSDRKEYSTFSAAISVKRKTTDAKNRDHDNCHTLVRIALRLTSCQQVYLVSKPSSWHCCFTLRESRVQLSAQRPIFLI